MSPRGASWGGPECGNKVSSASFLMVFRSNCGSVLLSFRDMTMGRTDGVLTFTTDA